MVMKKAGHFSVPSNQTGECTAIFLASLNNFLNNSLISILKNRVMHLKYEDAGNFQEKVRPHTCPMSEKIFPYLCLLETEGNCLEGQNNDHPFFITIEVHICQFPKGRDKEIFSHT